MWNDYLTFLDYLELRRRVERRLAGAQWLFLHALLFIFVAVLAVSYAASTFSWWNGRSYFLEPSYGQIMAVWSGVLAVHSLWTFRHSGASSMARGDAVEAEMRERIDSDDSYLSDNPKILFRLHGLLDDDIRRRAGSVAALMLFAVGNAAVWIPWAIYTPEDSFAWQITLFTGFLAGVLLLFGAMRRGRQEARLRRGMTQLPGTVEIPRYQPPRQREPDYARLVEDGELVDYDFYDEDEWEKGKRR